MLLGSGSRLRAAVLCLFAVGCVLADPPASRAAPVVVGNGLQRHFVWHTGDASVGRLPESGRFQFEERPRPPCSVGQIPGQSPDFCFNAAQPVTVQNRPTGLVLVRDPDSPALDTLFGSAGADAVLGPNHLQPLALDPMTLVTDPNDDPYAYVGDPLLTDGERGNPFRGPRTPTWNGLVRIVFGGGVSQQGPRTNEPFSYRWTQLDDQTRAAFPASIAPPCNPADPTCAGPDLPYPFDPVDPRIARDTDGDGILDAGQALIVLRNNPNTGLPPPSPPNPPGTNYSDPYPNNRFVLSLLHDPTQGRAFGGDYTGIIPCLTPDTTLQPLSEAQRQIRSATTPGCWSNIYVDGQPIPLQSDGTPARGRDIANTGGRGELPLRPAPDFSNLEPLANDAAQGLDYAAPPGTTFAREVDTLSGRPLIRGASGSGRCRDARLADGRIDPVGVPVFGRAASLVYAAHPNAPPITVGLVLESGDPNTTPPGFRPYWDALAPMMGGLGVGTDPNCLKPGGRSGGPNANLLDVAGAADLNGDGIPDPNWNAAFDGARPSPQNALEHQSANQRLFAWICELTLALFPSPDGQSCLATLFGSPNAFAPASLTTPEAFSSIFAGEPSVASASLATSPLLGIIQANQGKFPAELPVPIRPANSDLRDGVLTSTAAVFINTPGGQPYTPNGLFVPRRPDLGNLLSLDSLLTAEQRALLGCGPFYGTRCDNARQDRSIGFPEGGGIDLLNTEASALLSAAPGIFGTSPDWSTTSRTRTASSLEPALQAGTIGFADDTYCTRFDLASPLGPASFRCGRVGSSCCGDWVRRPRLPRARPWEAAAERRG
jgi:hypothetical protein